MRLYLDKIKVQKLNETIEHYKKNLLEREEALAEKEKVSQYNFIFAWVINFIVSCVAGDSRSSQFNKDLRKLPLRSRSSLAAAYG